MELELNREILKHYEPVLNTRVCQEETQEMIVPDALPDIMHIVETGGQLCVSEKSLRDGTVSIIGTVNGWVLYQPEAGGELCKMDVRIPFAMRADAPVGFAEGRCVIRPQLCKLDGRTLNPRKVLLRADIGAELCLYEPRELSLCSGIECPDGMDVQQLVVEQQAYLTTDVQEKGFSVYEEVHAPAGLDASSELLSIQADAWCTEARLIGTKLVVKGEAGVRIRYLTDGQVGSAGIPIGFSQIIEVDGAGEQADCNVDLYVTDVACVPAGEDGRTLNISLDLMAQAVVSDRFSLQVLQDAYSTCGEMTTDVEKSFVPDLLERYGKPQSMRERIETESQAKSVLDAAVHVHLVSVTGNTVETQLQAKVLYLDEQECLRAAEQTILIHEQLEVPENACCNVSCTCPGEAFASVTAGGLELRFTLELRGCLTRQQPMVTLKKANWDECERDMRSNRPSVVMRAVMPGECLWDIAKAYGTTMRRVCQANELESEDLPTGRLLLIPRGN